MNKEKVLIFGLCGESIFLNVDHFNKKGETVKSNSFHTEPGGKGYNQAVACKKMGIDTCFLSRVGDDDFGKLSISYLDKVGVKSKIIIDNKLPSAYATILTDKNGNTLPAPRHIAIIMDGNGRWAKKRGLPRTAGHAAGAEAFRRTANYCRTLGVKYLTVYAFSTENWGRPQAEVDGLMELVCKGVEMHTPELKKQGVSVKIIGDKSRFSQKVNEALARIEGHTAGGERMTLVLALNYSSRSEIVAATKELARRVKEGEIKAEDIDEKMISASLYTADMPDPDLIIRTSGEYRLSNFLMWQSAYSELYFTPTLWPDFNHESFREALEAYAGRNRRFGLVEPTK